MIETDARGFAIQIDDLDADWLLALAEDAEIQSRIAERRKLRLAYRGACSTPRPPRPGRRPGRMRGAGPATVRRRLAARVRPGWTYAADQFAAALQVSTLAGQQLMADSLNLIHRLPRYGAGSRPSRLRRGALAGSRS